MTKRCLYSRIHGFLYSRIDEILHYVWDPIGVKDVPQARDEYENYIPGLMRLLEAGTDAEQIAQYLAKVATEKMGLSSNLSKEALAAKIIMNWFNFLVSGE